MASTSMLYYLYKRNHLWRFRKGFVFHCNAIKYRLSMQTASLQCTQYIALRLQSLRNQMVTLWVPSHS
ncbi:hypothetical protein ACVWV0_000306 [Ewingella americana]